MNNDEKKIVNYLIERGFQVKEFTKKERKYKTPDLIIFKENKQIFCEVKSIEEDKWLEKKLREETFAFRTIPDPSLNSISNKVHEAVNQFDSVNEDLKYPNVLIFVNHERSYSVGTLINVLTGLFFATNGSRYSIYRKFSEGRIKDEKSRIHLYIWDDDLLRTDPYYLFLQSNKEHFHTLLDVFGKNLMISQIYIIRRNKLCKYYK